MRLAKKLSAVGNQRRAKLPPCVAKRIAQKCADSDGEATKGATTRAAPEL